MPLFCEVALDQYYQEHVTREVVDRARIEYAFEALKGFFTGKRIDKINIPLCREYRTHRGDVANSTVALELSVLRAAANHALRWERLEKMPVFEMPKAPQSKLLWLFKDELAAMLDAAERLDDRVFRFLQLAYHTASRKAAVERLRWGQIDLQARRLNLQPAGSHQTKKRRPIVPLSESMCAELAIMHSKRTTEFVLENGHSIRPVFDRVAKAAGVAFLTEKGMRPAGRLTPHVLRHTRATHLLQDGKPPYAVANLLGDNVATVLRIYGHACDSYMEDALDIH